MAPPVLLVDFAVFNPSADLRVNFAWHRKNSLETWKDHGVSMDKIEFCDRIYQASGIGDNCAALPAWLQPDKSDRPRTDIAHCNKEARMVQGQCVAEVLRKTGIEPGDIDILITNCSIYCPVPSMASLLVNMFGMRDDVQAYHLGGMGCSMGVVGLNLVRDLLAARPNSTALFVSNEVVTAGFYLGERREALITNSLFRMGGSAAILTNRPSWRLRAKYALEHVNRVHTGRYPRAFGSLNLEPDAAGVNGMVLTKDLPSEAALCLTKALTAAAPRVMSWRQYAEAAAHFARDAAARAAGAPRPAKYQPDFTETIDKFLIHAGGYAILQAVKKALRLPAGRALPSFVSLRDYGNTSSSSTWYTLAYIESCEGVAPRARALQIGVGGGMKAGVAVWRALRAVRDDHPAWRHLGGRPQTEADLPRPITVAYRSAYHPAAAVAAQERLAAAGGGSSSSAGGSASSSSGGSSSGGATAKAGGGERVKISFEPAKEPRALRVKSWKDVKEDDLDEWWRAPPGQPLAEDGGEQGDDGGGAEAAAAEAAAAVAAAAAAADDSPVKESSAAAAAGNAVCVMVVAE